MPIAQSLIVDQYGKDILQDIIELMIIPKPEESSRPFTQIKLIDLEDKLLRKIYVCVEETPASQLSIPYRSIKPKVRPNNVKEKYISHHHQLNY